jgi:hypothetical protein
MTFVPFVQSAPDEGKQKNDRQRHAQKHQKNSPAHVHLPEGCYARTNVAEALTVPGVAVGERLFNPPIGAIFLADSMGEDL